MPLSATDLDHPTPEQRQERSVLPGKAPFEVYTPQGFKPFYPDAPAQPESDEITEPNLTPTEDNPFPSDLHNPKGAPSLHYPQQATPLTSQQGVLTAQQLALPQHELANLTAQLDGLTPDDPRNPKGTPDYIVEGITDPDAPTTPHSISPTTAPVSTTSVTLDIRGAGFDESCTVTVGDLPIDETTCLSQNHLTVTVVPERAGTFPVMVDDDLHAGDFTVTEEGTDARTSP